MIRLSGFVIGCALCALALLWLVEGPVIVGDDEPQAVSATTALPGIEQAIADQAQSPDGPSSVDRALPLPATESADRPSPSPREFGKVFADRPVAPTVHRPAPAAPAPAQFEALAEPPGKTVSVAEAAQTPQRAAAADTLMDVAPSVGESLSVPANGDVSDVLAAQSAPPMPLTPDADAVPVAPAAASPSTTTASALSAAGTGPSSPVETAVAAQATNPARAGMAPETPSITDGALPASEVSGRFWAPVWENFRSEISARGFAGRLETLTGFEYQVVPAPPRRYQVQVAHADEAERLSRLSAIESMTGLRVSEHAAAATPPPASAGPATTPLVLPAPLPQGTLEPGQ